MENKSGMRGLKIATVSGASLLLLFVVCLLINQYYNSKNVLKVTSTAITDWSSLSKNDLSIVTLKYEIEMDSSDIIVLDSVISNKFESSLLESVKVAILNYEKNIGISELLVEVKYDKLKIDLYSYLIENPDTIRIKVTDVSGNGLITSSNVKFDLSKVADNMPDF